MALDPTVLLLVATVAGGPASAAPEFDAESSDTVEPDLSLDPDAAWNYARDPYPPCSMG